MVEERNHCRDDTYQAWKYERNESVREGEKTHKVKSKGKGSKVPKGTRTHLPKTLPRLLVAPTCEFSIPSLTSVDKFSRPYLLSNAIMIASLWA